MKKITSIFIKYFEIKILYMLLLLLFMQGCYCQRCNKNYNFPNFKISQNGFISFYENYPEYNSYVIADCDLDESLTWSLKIRVAVINIDIGKEDYFIKIIIDFIPKIEQFLNDHYYVKSHIGSIEISLQKVDSKIEEIGLELGESHIENIKVINNLLLKLRDKLWEKGIMLSMPNISYNDSDMSYEIILYRIDTDDLLYKKDGNLLEY